MATLSPNGTQSRHNRYIATRVRPDEGYVNRLVLPITLLPPLLICGCAAFMNSSSTFFLSNFSMEKLVKQNRSASGMSCAKGGLGGMGGGSFSVGREQSSSNKISSFSCQINSDSFDEAAFVESLKADVEQEITRNGATILNRGTSDPAGFYFEYSEREILGRISIDGKKSRSNYYSLVAKLDEKSGAASK
jgi:hypothetical protein